MELGQKEYSPRHTPLLPAGSIVGSYILFNCLGVSSRSAVYKCRHRDLDGPFQAIKIMTTEAIATALAAKRFQQEIVASYSVSHPNVMRTHEFINEEGVFAYTMEFMENGSLKQLLDFGEQLSIEEVINIAEQICSGVQAIHDAGIIHRNLKPGNIFFASDGTVKVSGFAFAKVESGQRLTRSGEVLGTVGYASPEYLQTGEIDQRADIYAIGLIVYEMITGTYPFSQANPMESLRRRMTTDPPFAADIRPDCPLELAEIVQRSLARNPAMRFDSAQQLKQLLENIKRKSTPISVNKLKRLSRPKRDSHPSGAPFINLRGRIESGSHTSMAALSAGIESDTSMRQLASGIALWGALLFVLGFLAFTVTANLDLLFGNSLSLESSPPELTLTNIYIVRPGDTLAAIAQRHNVDLPLLVRYNSLTDPNKLDVGRELKIPVRSEVRLAR